MGAKYYGSIEICATCGTGQLTRLRDGMIRKHKREIWENRQWTGGHETCPGSGQPHVDLVAENNARADRAVLAAQIEPKEPTVAPEPVKPSANCVQHPQVADERGQFADELPVPGCEQGVSYGIWNENDGGFVHTRDCALRAANDAAEFLTEDPDSDLRILAVCREHEDKPADTCAECFAEDEN